MRLLKKAKLFHLLLPSDIKRIYSRCSFHGTKKKQKSMKSETLVVIYIFYRIKSI